LLASVRVGFASLNSPERLKWSDVDYDPADVAVRVRREMEAAFARPNSNQGVYS